MIRSKGSFLKVEDLLVAGELCVVKPVDRAPSPTHSIAILQTLPEESALLLAQVGSIVIIEADEILQDGKRVLVIAYDLLEVVENGCVDGFGFLESSLRCCLNCPVPLGLPVKVLGFRHISAASWPGTLTVGIEARAPSTRAERLPKQCSRRSFPSPQWYACSTRS